MKFTKIETAIVISELAMSLLLKPKDISVFPPPIRVYRMALFNERYNDFVMGNSIVRRHIFMKFGEIDQISTCSKVFNLLT
jgi:hypothetical protein